MDRPLVIAHRGYSDRAPENTLAAFRMGWESGADGVECDIHLTKDGKVVCIHDCNTKRVAGKNLEIANAEWEDLRSLDVGSWKNLAWKGEGIPLLEDVLIEGPNDLLWMVEIKCGDEIVEPLLIAIDKIGPAVWERIIVISFNDDPLVRLKQLRPSIKSYWLSKLNEGEGGLFSPSVGCIVSKVESLGVDGFGGQSGRGISRELSRALKKSELELNVWTVNDVKELIRMDYIGVTSITTNDPTRILVALSEGA